MRILILGGDGYLGWPSAMRLAARGHSVVVADNYFRRALVAETGSPPLVPAPDLEERAEIFRAVSGHDVSVEIGDCTRREFMDHLLRVSEPDAVVHYAEQPSAPYSMMGINEARRTLENNLGTTFNLIWSVLEHAPQCHIVKLGTMGEYGTPNIDIEEGWIDIEHKGRRDRFLYPRQGTSLYHTTKIMDTDLLWFYVRMNGLRVTDLMQGPVYGLETVESAWDRRLASHFSYDDIFGTVLNRFVAQAVVDQPLTIYGNGGQTRGFLNIEDTLQCVELALCNPAREGELRVFNQFTECFTIRELADRVQRAAAMIDLDVAVSLIPNPRIEEEEHYYNAAHDALPALGLEPHLLTDEMLVSMLRWVGEYRDSIDERLIMPRVWWRRDD